MTDEQKDTVREYVEGMLPGTQVTLGQLNKGLRGLQLEKIYQLYEFVHDIARLSFRNYRFSRAHPLHTTILYRSEEDR